MESPGHATLLSPSPSLLFCFQEGTNAIWHRWYLFVAETRWANPLGLGNSYNSWRFVGGKWQKTNRNHVTQNRKELANTRGNQREPTVYCMGGTKDGVSISNPWSVEQSLATGEIGPVRVETRWSLTAWSLCCTSDSLPSALIERVLPIQLRKRPWEDQLLDFGHVTLS